MKRRQATLKTTFNWFQPKMFCVAAVGFVWAAATAPAQTFSVIKNFGSGVLTNVTGLNPYSRLVQGPDGTLYGTTSGGEGDVRGTVFKIQPDGSGFTVLKLLTNSIEGANPYAGLVLSGSLLYGTTLSGGISNLGTVFKLNTNGSGYTVLRQFIGADGRWPFAGLALSGNVLYGTTVRGGVSNLGTVFKLNTDGTGHTVIKHFTGDDGSFPRARLTLDGGTLYGTTSYGGSSNQGTVFKVNIDSTDYTVLTEFAGGGAAQPVAALTLSGSTLYGTASYSTNLIGGSSGAGAVFKLNTDGSGYAVIKQFNWSDGANPESELTLSGSVLYGTTTSDGLGHSTVFKMNIDGSGFTLLRLLAGVEGGNPYGGLTLSGNVLYGTAVSGGRSGYGTLFKLNTDSSGFAVLKEFTLSDGQSPLADLTLSGNTLYGTTEWGGSSGNGTVFKLNTDGTGYTVIQNFTDSHSYGAWDFPGAGVTVSAGVLYGATREGGSSGDGTVFKVNTDGTDYIVLKQFTGSDGQGPLGTLVLSNSTLYGTTESGGSSGYGTVFKLNSDGTGYIVLKDFGLIDGAGPEGALVLSGSTLYGTTLGGGSSNSSFGTVFQINTDGTGYTILKHFTGSDGANPSAGLTLDGSTLYGTTSYGGSSDYGTVFKMHTDGTGYTVLKHFSAPTDNPFLARTNSDGANPSAGLTLSGNTLYGTTSWGGTSGSGTVFKLNTDGTGYTVLKHFSNPDGVNSANSDGDHPSGGLTLSGSTLYGTTFAGGSAGAGTLFKIELSGLTPIPLSAQALGGTIILSWSNPSFALQAAPEVTGTYTNLPGATSPYTNAISGPQRFFRLVGN